jgi:uncharacterized RDD family membrane protein YckC
VSDDDVTHYELLGIERGAPKDEIRAAYQEQLADIRAARTREEESRKPSEDTLRLSREDEARLRAAWQVLSDPVQRERYDARLAPTPDGTGEPAADELAGEDEDDRGGRELAPAAAPAASERPTVGGSMISAQGLEIPSPGRRLTAAAIDAITMGALWAVIVYPLTLAVGLKSGLPAFITEVGTMEFLIVVWLIIPTWRTGQSLGKRYTYCMVVDRATGELAPLGQIFRRYVIPMFAFALLVTTGGFIALIYALSFLMNKDQISLADRFAKTAVVIARYRPTRPGN